MTMNAQLRDAANSCNVLNSSVVSSDSLCSPYVVAKAFSLS